MWRSSAIPTAWDHACLARLQEAHRLRLELAGAKHAGQSQEQALHTQVRALRQDLERARTENATLDSR